MESFLDNIGCPFALNIKFDSREHIIGLVCWLEDQKIRQLELVDRDQLRIDSPLWDTHFSNYLTELGCPYSWQSGNLECVYWLIYQATSLEFEEKFQEQVLAVNEQDEGDIREALSKLGSLFDLSIDDFATTTGKLKIIMEMPFYQLSDFVNHLSVRIKYCLPSNSKQEHSMESFPLGINLTDAVVAQLALALKMLYLSDFRELQNDVNALIVLGQEFTANPKLNSSLGRVGR